MYIYSHIYIYIYLFIYLFIYVFIHLLFMLYMLYIYVYIYIYIYRLVPSHGTTYDGVGGWGGMLTFMWSCRSSWCYAHVGGVGWVGWDVNVHVKLQKHLMLMLMMMMMMTTLMKLVNSANEISSRKLTKFYQPNSGLRGSKTEDKAIWWFPEMGVPPNLQSLIGFSTINHPLLGTPILGNPHILA